MAKKYNLEQTSDQTADEMKVKRYDISFANDVAVPDFLQAKLGKETASKTDLIRMNLDLSQLTSLRNIQGTKIKEVKLNG